MEAEAPAPVLFEKQGRVAWIQLNRPAVLNAINLEMRDQLWEAIAAVRDDPDIAACVISGAGDRAFSAGADISEFGTAPSYLAARAARHDRDLWAALLTLEKPMIAAIQGFAYGAGCEMSLCCDLRIAASNARFALPEVALGYIPSAGGTQLLPRTISSSVALEMILGGNAIGAAQALRLGLVHKVVDAEQLYDEARAQAARFVQLRMRSVRLAKRAMAAAYETEINAGLAIEAQLAARVLQS